MVAYVIKFQLCFLLACLPLSFHLPCLSLLCLLVCPFLSGCVLLPCPSLPPPFFPFYVPSLWETVTPLAFSPTSTILLSPSLLTFCWVATFKVLKFSKSVIVCPNLGRRSSRNNKPEKQNVLQKSPSWRILSGHNMIVDKEWRKLFTELPIIIYWVLRAVSDSEMNKAWSMPSRILNIVQKIQRARIRP